MQNRQIIDREFAAAGVAARPHVEADSVAARAHVHQLVEPDVAPTVGLVTRAGPLASPAARLLRELLEQRRLPG